MRVSLSQKQDSMSVATAMFKGSQLPDSLNETFEIRDFFFFFKLIL